MDLIDYSWPAMRAFSIPRGRALLLVLIQVGAFLSAPIDSPGQLPPTINSSSQKYERRCLAKIKGMMASHELTEWQLARIEYLLGEQHTMIDLFSKHGLLSQNELQKKISTILEVTRFNVDDVFTPDQLGIWLTWDLKLDATEVEKPRFRRPLLLTP